MVLSFPCVRACLLSASVCLLAVSASAKLVVNDPKPVSLRYALPKPIEDGAVEFDVRGLDSRAATWTGGRLVSMLDASAGGSTTGNPWRFEWSLGKEPGSMSFAMDAAGVRQFESSSQRGSRDWFPVKTYRFGAAWRDGIVRCSVDGQDVSEWAHVYGVAYRPKKHEVRIGPIPGAVFSNVRIHDNGSQSAGALPSPVRASAPAVARKYQEYEIVLLTEKAYANPYLEVDLSATFRGPSQTVRANGFWDGGKVFRIRMLPTEPGTWTWTVSASDSRLNGRSGSLTCEDSTSPGYVRVSKEHPHSFEWAGDGKPYFLLGDTMWHLWYNVRYSDGTFQKMIDARAAQRFNYIHGVVHNVAQNEGGPIYNRQRPDGDYDCDALNPGYFQWVDKKVAYMNERGIVAALLFAWGNEGYQHYTSPEQYKRYIRYLVARYGSRNVFWLIAGEFEEAGEPDARWVSYLDTVRENDPYGHPTSLHTVNTTDRFGDSPSQTFIGHQRKGTPEYLRGLVEASRKFGKPVVNLEYGYESTTNAHRACQDADQLRMDHYAITLGGGYAVFGNAVPGFMTFHKSAGFNPNATNSLGARQMAMLYDFFTSLDFQRLEPAQQLVDKGICACIPNRDYIVQILSAGSVTVDLSAATGEFSVDWFDPKTGRRTPSGTITGGDKRTFTSPPTPPAQWVTDWILHIHRDAREAEGEKVKMLTD